MTKPHEETWEYRPTREDVVVREPNGDYAIMDLDHDAEFNPTHILDARGRLAAAAPEMARLLLELEWAGSEWDYGGSDPCCPCCGERAPMQVHIPAKRIDAYTRTEARDEVRYGKHTDNCQLVAVLRKAGVLRHGEEP